MVEHTLKILHYLLQDFERVFNLFVDIRRYRVKIKTSKHLIVQSQQEKN